MGAEQPDIAIAPSRIHGKIAAHCPPQPLKRFEEGCHAGTALHIVLREVREYAKPSHGRFLGTGTFNPAGHQKASREDKTAPVQSRLTRKSQAAD